jgi:CBS domain-containing protein
MLMPTLSRYMTRRPWTIAPTATLAEAHRLMREHGIATCRSSTARRS